MPQLKLYTSPRACSTGCHIALEESGLAYDVEVVRIREGQHRHADYLQINPWGKVPSLVIDGAVLTEAHAILSWIGDSAKTRLVPPSDALARARTHEWMGFLASTVHIAFRPLFRPHTFVADERLYPKLREMAIPNLRNTLAEVDRRLAGRKFALGDAYSVVDPYLLVFWIWSQRADIVPHVADMPHWRAQSERVFERPATWKCLNREGITSNNIANP